MTRAELIKQYQKNIDDSKAKRRESASIIERSNKNPNDAKLKKAALQARVVDRKFQREANQYSGYVKDLTSMSDKDYSGMMKKSNNIYVPAPQREIDAGKQKHIDKFGAKALPQSPAQQKKVMQDLAKHVGENWSNSKGFNPNIKEFPVYKSATAQQQKEMDKAVHDWSRDWVNKNPRGHKVGNQLTEPGNSKDIAERLIGKKLPADTAPTKSPLTSPQPKKQLEKAAAIAKAPIPKPAKPTKPVQPPAQPQGPYVQPQQQTMPPRTSGAFAYMNPSPQLSNSLGMPWVDPYIGMSSTEDLNKIPQRGPFSANQSAPQYAQQPFSPYQDQFPSQGISGFSQPQMNSQYNPYGVPPMSQQYPEYNQQQQDMPAPQQMRSQTVSSSQRQMPPYNQGQQQSSYQQAPYGTQYQQPSYTPQAPEQDPSKWQKFKKGTGEFLTGKNPSVTSLPNYTPDVNAALQGLLSGSMAGLSQRQYGVGDFAGIENQARRDFSTKTLPQITNRFAGSGLTRSSGFRNALAGAGADLESQLGAQRTQYGLQRQGMDDALMSNLAQLGLQQRVSNIYSPATGGAIQAMAPAIGKGVMAAGQAGLSYLTGGML